MFESKSKIKSKLQDATKEVIDRIFKLMFIEDIDNKLRI